MTVDRFGNTYAPGLPYARGDILSSTEDDFHKCQQSWRYIAARFREHGSESIFNFSGLEHGLPLLAEELSIANDFVAPALYFDIFRQAALDHLGGDPEQHDVALFNRLTGATYATLLTLVKPGDVVIGVSASYSHPSVVRAVANAGARLIDSAGIDDFEAILGQTENVALVVLTRLAVTYDIMPTDDLYKVVDLAHDKGVPVYVDDAGGARVGPAIFDQPRMLQLGVDVVATGLDKYGTAGPRLGVMAGHKALVSRIRACAFEMGLEARPLFYPAAARSLIGSTPERVQELVATAREVAAAIKAIIGDRLSETAVIAELRADDILEMAMQRADLSTVPIAPYEASAALAMLLLRDYGVITVHFVGLPPGTSSLMLKFIAPHTLKQFGGAQAYAKAIDVCIDTLSIMLKAPEQLRRLLLGDSTD
ncbi:MAG: aminotransferase class I/II-fold pyridoxal phosphate-dependent enzyme [bacterium]|nr:aminotransferase class I/II-fold pyridoxal phosphate-dependent enzyme [bacterium]